MKKLRLRLDDLAVEGFETTRVQVDRGTVQGAQGTFPFLQTCGATCYGTCPNTCPNTCAQTCDDFSCAESCGGTCFQSRCVDSCLCN
jgi:hypothetical protein